jgi:ABC-type phosphate transport system ATPase subunit
MHQRAGNRRPATLLPGVNHGGENAKEFIRELTSISSIVIVTHNMQQAARCSYATAFLCMGGLVEFDRTEAAA